MKKSMRSRSLFALLLAACAAPASALDPAQVFEKVSPSVWVVRTFDASDRPVGLGSAVVIGPGRLATNCHVLAKSNAVLVRRKNVMYEAKLEHADAPRDLCVLSVEGFSAPAVTKAPRESERVGQKVYAIGNPRGLEVTLSEGLVSGLRGEWSDGSHVLQTTAPISPGSSGGGLFDEEGRLVGITTFTRADSQNLNFALPAHWIDEVPARAEAALARRKEATAAVAETGTASAPPGVPAAGTVWVYRMTERANRNRIAQITVRADHVDSEFVEETVVLAGGDAPPARRTVSTRDARFLRYHTGRESELLELAPYLLAENAGKGPDQAIQPTGYSPPDTRPAPFRSEWITSVQPRDWEEVSVPAGKYRALRYEVKGKRGTPPMSGIGTPLTEFRVNVWYAPDVRRIVKLEHQSWTYNPSPYVDDQVELIEYRPPRR
jgi:Trypsin-like peptidase domain